MVDSS
jgi:hypothetical protein